jgi:GAF domain-containing protein
MGFPNQAEEDRRLKEVDMANILHSLPEEEYDSLVQLIAAITDCPISLISIIGRDKQWFKSKVGLSEDETARDVSFCDYAIRQEGVMVVEDAYTDERFANNPYVAGINGIRFYAGISFKSPAGYPIGTLCVLDTKPRQLNEAKLRALEIVAAKIGALVQARFTNLASERWVERIERMYDQRIADQQTEYTRTLQTIGLQIHEDYAQTITACMQFIDFARSKEEVDPGTINRVHQVLGDVLMRMRTLSQQINPSHFNP